MLDDLSYGARIDYHTRAILELFSQVKENRQINIQDIAITRFGDADWKDFILQTITLNGGTEEIFGNEQRPLTNLELSLIINFPETSLGSMFRNELVKNNLLPVGI